MRYLLLSILFVGCIHCAKAQDDAWFKGSWFGMKSFSGARLGIKAPVRIEIDSISEGRFSGRFIYMYPKDTIARLVRTFTGNIKGYAIRLDIGAETFLLDPRSRSFWSNCAPCSETGSFYLDDSALVFKITTGNCGDSCNAESVFSRKIVYYNPPAQAGIRQFFSDTTAAIDNRKQIDKETQPANKSLLVVNNKKDVSKPGNISPDSIETAGNSAWIRDSEDSIALALIETDGAISVTDTNNLYAFTDTSYNNSLEKNIGINSSNKNTVNLALRGNHEAADAVNSLPGKTAPLLLQTESLDTAMQTKINRETALVNSYYVDSPHILVDLFDNGTIDSDAVSVYYNGKLIVNNAMLSYKAVSFSIDASAGNRHLEFILIAENEGSIPPNSALMRITSGNKQFKLFVSTSITKNVKIAFDYTGP